MSEEDEAGDETGATKNDGAGGEIGTSEEAEMGREARASEHAAGWVALPGTEILVLMVPLERTGQEPIGARVVEPDVALCTADGAGPQPASPERLAANSRSAARPTRIAAAWTVLPLPVGKAASSLQKNARVDAASIEHVQLVFCFTPTKTKLLLPPAGRSSFRLPHRCEGGES